jgi:hypothetical protein
MNEMVIKLKLEEMIRYGYVCVARFPKAERFTLVADLKSCMYTSLRLVITANKRYHKKNTLQDLDIEFEMLKSLVRLAKELGFLPFNQYEHWQKLNVEIGRMIGGWIKSSRGEA